MIPYKNDFKYRSPVRHSGSSDIPEDDAEPTSARENGAGKDQRRTPRVRVSVPFPCGFSRIGPSRWRAEEKSGYGVIFDVSIKGARVMSQVRMNPGDELALTLRMPHQPIPLNVDATVRWRQDNVFGLEFGFIPETVEMRFRKLLARL